MLIKNTVGNNSSLERCDFDTKLCMHGDTTSPITQPTEIYKPNQGTNQLRDKPIWAPDKQVKYFRIRFQFREDIRSQSSKKSTPRCAAPRGVKILVLEIQNFFLQILSYMIE